MDLSEYIEIRAALEGRGQAQLNLPTKGAVMNRWAYLGLSHSSAAELDKFHQPNKKTYDTYDSMLHLELSATRGKKLTVGVRAR